LALAPEASGLTNKRMSKLPAIVFVAALPALSGLALGCSRDKSATPSGATLAASPVAGSPTPLAAGAQAPDVTFQLHTGEKLSLKSLRGKPVVVYFYPKDDTPGCTVEAQEIRDLYEELKRTGAVVIGVSTDAPDSHRAFAEKHALPFLLASDAAGDVAKAFGVALKNGRMTRVSFVIGADGRIKRTFPQVTPKGHAAELLQAISS
jgi:peroxiredoxin Q/BCP